jgi:hypothetical protein
MQTKESTSLFFSHPVLFQQNIDRAEASVALTGGGEGDDILSVSAGQRFDEGFFQDGALRRFETSAVNDFNAPETFRQRDPKKCFDPDLGFVRGKSMKVEKVLDGKAAFVQRPCNDGGVAIG